MQEIVPYCTLSIASPYAEQNRIEHERETNGEKICQIVDTNFA